jgi:hypothetical protein
VLSQRSKNDRQPFAEVIRTGTEDYVVANKRDNSAVMVFGSHAMAEDALAATDPLDAEELHVIPASEAVTA